MSSKLKRALKIRDDLKYSKFEPFTDAAKTTVYTLKHAYNDYSIWTGNGYWFISIYESNGENVNKSPDAKFGIIGKLLVWWEARKQVKQILEEQAKDIDSWVFKHYD